MHLIRWYVYLYIHLARRLGSPDGSPKITGFFVLMIVEKLLPLCMWIHCSTLPFDKFEKITGNPETPVQVGKLLPLVEYLGAS